MTPTPRALAAPLLLVGALAQLAWHQAPEDIQAQVWNLSQAELMLVLLVIVASVHKDAHLRLVCALLGAWQAMTAGCSTAWIANPWPVSPGQAQCSAALDVPLWAIAAWVIVLVACAVRPE